MRLIFVRHGQTPSNVQHLLDTAVPGPGLTELGREQAAALPAAFVGIDLAAIYVSDLIRTHETAAALAAARGLAPIERGGLREISAGDFEMSGTFEAVSAYHEATVAWVSGDLDVRLPGGEDGHEVLGRFDEVVTEICGNGHDTVAVVSHGAVLRTWVGARATNISADFIATNFLSNTGVIVVEGTCGQEWRTLMWDGNPLGGFPYDDAHDGPAGDAFRSLWRGNGGRLGVSAAADEAERFGG